MVKYCLFSWLKCSIQNRITNSLFLDEIYPKFFFAFFHKNQMVPRLVVLSPYGNLPRLVVLSPHGNLPRLVVLPPHGNF